MNPIKDGGPAFPVEFDVAQPEGFQVGNTRWQGYGISVRDYFAASVVPPNDIARSWGEIMVAPYPKSDDGMTDAPFGRPVIEWWQAVDAAWRYAQADAMLKAREQ